MPVRSMIGALKTKTPRINIPKAIQELLSDHPLYLNPIPRTQLERLLVIIAEKNKLQVDFEETENKRADAPFKYSADLIKIDLNRLNDVDLNKYKKEMDIEFEKARVEKKSPDFIYDKKKEFGPPTETNDWDSDSSSGEVKRVKDNESVQAPLRQDVNKSINQGTIRENKNVEALGNDATSSFISKPASELSSLKDLPPLFNQKNAKLTQIKQPSVEANNVRGIKSESDSQTRITEAKSHVDSKEETPSKYRDGHSQNNNNSKIVAKENIEKMEEVISDFEDDFAISNQDEDEEFLKMIKKTKTLPSNVGAVEVSPVQMKIEPTADALGLKRDLLQSDKIEEKANSPELKQNTPATLKPTNPLSSLANLPPIKGPANLPPISNALYSKNLAEIEKIKKEAASSKAEDFNLENFGAGNTDSEGGEIVFSDDGLSFDGDVVDRF